MSKFRLTYAGGRYAGKKIVDLVKSIKRSNASYIKNQKAKRFEKAHGHKLNKSTAKPYQNVSSSGSR